jgi:hypothetical protein
MARNLQAKLPTTDTLRIYDINPNSLKKFADETKALSGGAAVEVANSVREAAEDSVSSAPLSSSFLLFPLPSVMSLFHYT